MNMNLGILQCKNYWKWEYTTFSYQAQESKYIKYNDPHKTEYYQQFAQYCKANFKTNLLRLETKQEELCLYTFKYLNYKDEHQADMNICPFWKYCFNREWHSKKY